MPRIYAIDFDGVICNPNDVAPGKRMGNPMPGCKDSMNMLKSKGHTLIIYTVRATVGRDLTYLKDWLTFFDIPYDDIAIAKPQADKYLDDKNVVFTNWRQALTDLNE